MECSNCGNKTEGNYCNECGFKLTSSFNKTNQSLSLNPNNNNNDTKRINTKHNIILHIIMFSAILISSFNILQSNKNYNMIQKDLESINSKIFILESSAETNKAAILDPSNLGGYTRFDSNSGAFLVSLKDLQPYLDGYRVILEIGNPSSVTYNGFNLKAEWGESLYNFTGDKKAHHIYKRDFSFIQELRPGTWNKVDLAITPIKKDEFGYLKLSIETDTISLKG